MRLYTLEIVDTEGERYPIGQHRSLSKEGAEEWASEVAERLIGWPHRWSWSNKDLYRDIVRIIDVGSAHWEESYTGCNR
jgi:hypothetical protein